MSEKLNILWISLEDCSPRFGCYGDPLAATPHIDALARQGRLYSNAFSTAPVCAPARCAIITGMYAASIGAHHMRVFHKTPPAFQRLPTYQCVPPPFVKLLPEYLRAAGYFCTNNEKTDYQFALPFTAWDEQGSDSHWRHRSPGQPFFAVFNNVRTHESGMWEPEDGADPVTNPAAVQLPPYLPDTPKTRRALARHYDNIHANDRWVGNILAQLEEDGLAENTLVILWSDHGEGLPRHKRWLYDTGLRVPCIVRWPGVIPSGETSPQIVSTIDLAPTVLTAAGIPVPTHMQGRDFLAEEKDATRPHHIFATRDRYDEFYDCQRAVRDERFKFIRTYYPASSGAFWNDYSNKHPAMQEIWRLHCEDKLPEAAQFFFRHPRPVEELYDTSADPWELNNIANAPEHRAKLLEMRAALDTWQRDINDLYREPEEAMIERFWPRMQQPETKSPVLLAYDSTKCGEIPGETIRLTVPAILQMHAPTQGASVGYQISNGDSANPDPHWQLYTAPIRLAPGTHIVTAKSIRIGYKESAVVRCNIIVEG